MIEVNCTGCGIKTPVYPYEIKDGHGNFHSKECYDKWRGKTIRGEKHPSWKGGKVEVICDYCSIPFFTKRYKVNRDQGNYHNKECADKARIGTKASEETKSKLRLARIGQISPMKGKHHSEETKRKLSLTHVGRKNTKEHGENISIGKKGKPNGRLGLKLSTETKQKIGLGNKGKTRSEETKKKLSEINRGKYKGENSPHWKGGITPLKHKIRTSFEYKQWRQKIFLRDDFVCQDCKQRGGKLHVHHKKSFSKLIQEAKDCLPLFELYTACLQYSPLWDISNGVTLCKDCHKKTKDYGWKGINNAR